MGGERSVGRKGRKSNMETIFNFAYEKYFISNIYVHTHDNAKTCCHGL